MKTDKLLARWQQFATSQLTGTGTSSRVKIEDSFGSITQQNSSRLQDVEKWKKCIEVLSKLWIQRVQRQMTLADSEPNENAIQNAIAVLQHLKRAGVISPPTLISREPAGGIIVEINEEVEGVLREWTFYNDSTIEYTKYHHGRIVLMEDVSEILRKTVTDYRSGSYISHYYAVTPTFSPSESRESFDSEIASFAREDRLSVAQSW